MIPDYIIKRAADLWMNALLSPTYDNGDKTEQGIFGQTLQIVNSIYDLHSDIEKKISGFKVCLIARLTYSQQYVPETYMFERYLFVDYQPCRLLAEVAEETGIPLSLFSIKSEVYIGDYYVRSRFGYSAETHYHYRLPNQDKWLVINSLLTEKDLDVVLEAVMEGRINLYLFK